MVRDVPCFHVEDLLYISSCFLLGLSPPYIPTHIADAANLKA
jgi:hypothetical protein